MLLFKQTFFIFMLLLFTSCKQNNSVNDVTIDQTLKFSAMQSLSLFDDLKLLPNKFPKSINDKGELETCNDKWWTSGFFPGTLWYLYEYTKDEKLLLASECMTDRLIRQQYTTDNHDVGFIINCSYGNGYRIKNNHEYKDVIINAAKSLATRFNIVTGCIKSWNSKKWQYPVIIDNMMNLELLTLATRLSDDSSFLKIAVSHADTTMKYHFRADGSSYHVVDYDTINGGYVNRFTHQGAHDESSWARGQSWALYGYTMMYRETKLQRYLDHAQKVADYIVSHPNLPEDKIPYWDFNAPNIPNELRDASAASVIASALVELSSMTSDARSNKYRGVAKEILLSLSSPEYLAEYESNGKFLLKHSVGFYAKNSEVDAPLSYADYYFIEALIRYKKLIQNEI